MRVVVTGGTGFLGSEIVRCLVHAGHHVEVLARQADRLKIPGAEPIVGEIGQIATWEERLKGFDACINCIGILKEERSQGVTFEKLHYQATVDLLRSCGKMGLTRFIQISANGVEKGLNTPYMRTKATAEQAVRSSSMTWTILRPSVIYAGEPGKMNFVDMLKRHLDALPFFPYFGDGSYRMSPIAAREVALTVAHCLGDEQTAGKVYHLCGSETYTYKALLHLLNEAGKYRCGFFSLPVWLGTQASSVLGSLGLPITADMLKMLVAGNDCPQGVLTQRDLGIPEMSFRDWLVGSVLPEGYEVRPLPKEAASTPVRQAEPTRHLEAEEAPVPPPVPPPEEPRAKPTRYLELEIGETSAQPTRPLNAEQAPEI